ncbi:DUF6935 domain-containing protein [Prevotella sp. OH937_COT-195]|uniref:DUF6935 domain-containing protein n=1 Tax=Prevotella sp. OH937_COT-195 TaxID=2491051 RepID=UPI000F6477F6|nr:hypothetical protein [Prevotella sp. OH937_COT-195]RRD02682.1 hypothetical protein EII32_01315 [Prevotella sp. OH937_COT-195]
MGFLDFLSGNKSKDITFRTLPKNIDELKVMPQAGLTDEFEVAALVVAALCRYEESIEDSLEMLNFLKGPSPLCNMDVQFLRDRLYGKTYKTRSFLAGATPNNGYTPSVPFTVKVSSNPHSYVETLATLYLHSGGADSPRPISLRKKPSTGQWFVTQFSFLADIRLPVEENPWA